MADTGLDLNDLRRREVQAIGAAISTRNWHSLETAYNSLRDKLDRAGHTVSASAQPAPAFPREEVARQEMYAILRKWDVGDFASRVCSGKGHGSLPADICEAELDAFGESLIAALLQGKQT